MSAERAEPEASGTMWAAFSRPYRESVAHSDILPRNLGSFALKVPYVFI